MGKEVKESAKKQHTCTHVKSLPVCPGTKGKDLSGKSKRGDEHAVVKVVGGRKPKPTNHVVHVNRINDGKRPHRSRTKHGGVAVFLGVHGVEGVAQDGDDGGHGSDDHAKVGKGVAEKPTRCYFIAVLADGKNVLGRKEG